MARLFFKTQIALLANKIERRVEASIKDAALSTFTSVVDGTPVDTGRARGNWQLGVGEAIKSRTNNTTPQTATAVSALQAYSAKDLIHISNNLPYIRRLEYGWSNQAPNGMVRLALQDFGPALERALKYYSR